MCRNIKTLYNIDPAATEEEIQNAALQFVRKISGHRKPSKVNEAAFETAVLEIAALAQKLLDELETVAAPRSREDMAVKARERSQKRFS